MYEMYTYTRYIFLINNKWKIIRDNDFLHMTQLKNINVYCS
jgi:hypothetical protein